MAGPDSSNGNEEAGARQSTGLDSSLKEKEIEAIHLCFTQEVQSEYSTRDLSFPTHYRVGAPGGSAELAEVWAPDGPASKLRNADCGMRIAKENPKNPKSEIRNPK